MELWVLLIKDDKIIGGGKNIVFDGSFDRVIPTTEQFARQGMKLDLIDGKLVVKENVSIQSLDELNAESELLVKEITETKTTEVELQTPINL